MLASNAKKGGFWRLNTRRTSGAVCLIAVLAMAGPALGQTATIWDAWWTHQLDSDGDGCWVGTINDNHARLHWDPDVLGHGSLTVWETIRWNYCGHVLSHWTTTAPHVITGGEPDDVYIDLPRWIDCHEICYMIEVYRVGEIAPDDIRDWSNDSDLSQEEYQTASTHTVAIADAWWTHGQDWDADGCKMGLNDGYARLHWDPDVVASSDTAWVIDVVYSRSCGETDWQWMHYSKYQISGNVWDDRYLDIPMSPDCACREYRITLDNAGGESFYIRDPSNDPDLSQHLEESPSEDQRATIYNAWWTNQQDNDGDGCGAGNNNQVRLNFDSDVASGNGSISVYEYVYYKNCNTGSWTYAAQTAPHTITGRSTDDTQHVDLNTGSACACYDYRIDVFRSDQSIADDTRDPSNDVDLNDHWEEELSEDTSWATIYDAWWSDRQDEDADECWAGSQSGIAQLHWDPNVVGAGSLTVYEKIFRKPCGSGTWNNIITTAAHQVSGQGSGDARYTQIETDGGCACNEYRIDIYRLGQGTPDVSLTSPADPDLGGKFEESFAEDVVVATIANAWWRDQEDADHDGCWEGTRNGAARLFWDADVTNDDSLTVFEKIYARLCDEGALVLVNTTAPHVITTQSSADAQYIDLPMHANCACHEYRVEVYRAGWSIPDDARDWTNDPDLDNHYEEIVAPPEDRAVIASAGWGDEQDLDSDGCVTGTLNGMAGLYWIPDVVGSGSPSVFEVLSRKECSSGTWLVWGQTNPHVINPGGQNPVQFRAVPPHPDCACWDYRIEIYRAGQGAADDTWDLCCHHEELVAQDCGGLMFCDFDANCVIDLADYTPMRGCWAGPNRPPQPDPPLTAPQCLGVYDADQDGDVDLMTFAYFQNHYRRPPSP